MSLPVLMRCNTHWSTLQRVKCIQTQCNATRSCRGNRP